MWLENMRGFFMEDNPKKIIIVGASGYASLMREAFDYDSPYSVVGFSVEKKFLKSEEFDGLPVVDIENIENYWASSEHFFHVAIGYYGLNRHRERLVNSMIERGYSPASYISSRATISPSARIGLHCVIADRAIIQSKAVLGDNIVFYGSTIGHDAVIANNCFFSVGSLVLGYTQIGEYSFIGAGAVIVNDLVLGSDCVIGAGAVVSKNLPDNTLIKPLSGECVPNARAIFGVWEKTKPRKFST